MFGPSVSAISPAEVPALLGEGWLLLDVRTEEEWADGHIPGAVHIPMHELVERLDEVADPVICVCAVGARSARVTHYLVQQGWQAVNLDGGVYRWVGEGRPLEV